MENALKSIAIKARAEADHRFGGLYSLLNTINLRSAYYELNPKASTGVDRVSHAEYGIELDANVSDMVEMLKQKKYTAKLIRRVHIPKGPDTTRPLGILCISDKLAQRVAAQILGAIYEQDFCEFSYAYRKGKSQRDAVRALSGGLMGSRCTWVVELDIQSYYDKIDHDILMKLLEERISDRSFLQLIRKWLRAGVLETNGRVEHPATGTPQGGIVSSVLANIYLHHALDTWFVKEFKSACEGDALMIRYADDVTAAFQFHRDAMGFYRKVEDRLKEFGLTLAKEKCGVHLFSRHRKRESKRFDFLGFEFRWGRSRFGKNRIKLRTSRKKFRKAVAAFTAWIRKHCNKRIKWIFDELNAKLRGYYAYYGVTDNSRSLASFLKAVRKILYRWLNRRSERKSYNWKTYKQMLDYYTLEKPKIVWDLFNKSKQYVLALG